MAFHATPSPSTSWLAAESGFTSLTSTRTSASQTCSIRKRPCGRGQHVFRASDVHLSGTHGPSYMMSHFRASAAICLAALGTLYAACGKSGTAPITRTGMYVQTTLNGQPLPVRTLGEDVNYMELAADTLTLRADHTFHEIRWLRTTDKRSTPPKVQTISGIFDGTYVDTD